MKLGKITDKINAIGLLLQFGLSVFRAGKQVVRDVKGRKAAEPVEGNEANGG